MNRRVAVWIAISIVGGAAAFSFFGYHSVNEDLASHGPGSENGPQELPLPVFAVPDRHIWSIRSIDTMKYSRDLARVKLHDKSFLSVIDRQIHDIAMTGASHVSIDTPYDQEFYPMLEAWVEAARRYRLNVWFRGNFSGWEEWFGYPRIGRMQHIRNVDNFIRSHGGLFRDGDIFSACPECENGGPGDPRVNKDVAGFREFIISEHRVAKEAFAYIGKDVRSNIYPMNLDVATLVMDKETTQAMDGEVAVDHYVASPSVLSEDLEKLGRQSGGDVILGEFGAPLPGETSVMNRYEQSEWIAEALARISEVDRVIGVNYWVNAGGSTGIWDIKGAPYEAVTVLTKYFQADRVFGFVSDDMNRPIPGAKISGSGYLMDIGKEGLFIFRVYQGFPLDLEISAPGYEQQTIHFDAGNQDSYHVTLKRQ